MKIHHIGYMVKNIKKSTAAFIRLGYDIEQDIQEDHNRKAFIVFMVNDSYRIELVQPIDESSDYYPLSKKYRNSPYHICYCTEYLDETIVDLKKEGYILVRPPEKAVCLNEKRVAFLSCLGVELIELVEM